MDERRKDELVHEVDSENHHRLIINNEPGEWFQEDQIAVNGIYYATNIPQFGGVDFPTVFTIMGQEFTLLPDTEDAS